MVPVATDSSVPQLRPASSGRRLGLALLLGALLLGAWGMAPQVSSGEPWQRSWLGHNGARYTHIARNHARFGLLTLGGAPLLETAPAAGQTVPWEGRDPLVYGHHPPGVAWSLGALFLVTGVDETVARITAALATLLSLGVLFLLVGGVAGPVAGGAAALFCAAMPMTTVYGVHVEVQGPYVLLAFLVVLLLWQRLQRGGRVAPFVVACVLSSFLDWFGLYAPAVCVLDALLDRPRRPRAAAWTAALTAVLFAGWFLWLASLPGLSVDKVLGAAGVRGPGALSESGALLAEYAARWWTDVGALLPLWPIVLGVALFGAVRRPTPGDERARRASGLLRQLLLPPLVHAALFPAGMLVHAYWLFALPPALAAGLVLVGGARGSPRLGRVARFVLAPAVVLLGVLGTRAALPPADPFPALLGQALAAHTAPGDWVLTNHATNVLRPDAPGDAHVTRLPEVTYYADRPVRGGVGILGAPGVTVDLDDALRRCPEAAYFLEVTPFGAEPSASLGERLSRLSAGQPLELSGAPVVRLHRLAPR